MVARAVKNGLGEIPRPRAFSEEECGKHHCGPRDEMIGAERPGLRVRHARDAPAEARPTFESSPIVKAVRSLDAYPKVQEDYVVGSTAGGIITFVCAAICALLFLSEYAHHRTTVITSEVKVAVSYTHLTLPTTPYV